MFSIRLLSIIVIVLLANACSTATRQQAVSEEPITVTGELSVTPAEKHLYRQAITALNAGDLNEAESLLKAFHQQKPEFAGPLANLGLVYYKQGNRELATETLNRALEKNSQQAQALNLLGQIAYDDGQATIAEDYYKRALAIREDYANAHYNLALVYDIYFQDIASAVAHYRRYMELTNFSDQDTANWLEQLENSLKSG
jgi:tetratricopeptide (TPR) repeat protein